MTIPEGYSGNDFLLQIANPDAPTTYVTIGGLRSNNLQLNNEQFDVTTKDGTRFQKLITGGIQKMSLSGAGISKQDAPHAYLKKLFMSNLSAVFKISSGAGDVFIGTCFLKSYQRQGAHTSPEDFSIALESSGTVVYTAPAPDIVSLTPATGVAAGGLPVTITGTGFQYGATVLFGATAATAVVVVNETTITCTSPAHIAGTVSVIVTNWDAQLDTLPTAFIFT